MLGLGILNLASQLYPEMDRREGGCYKRRVSPRAVPAAAWSALLGPLLLGAAFLAWWAHHNPLPDGWQNEYLHVGNAADLWGALVEGDLWHLRWYMYTGYWPWGFLAVPWPIFATAGPSLDAMRGANILHLAVLVGSAWALGRRLEAPGAPWILVLLPGVLGALVRFEPNLAALAWTAAGLASLNATSGLRDRRAAIGFGLSLGVGLLMDRLTVAFFLIPALLPHLRGAGRRGALHLALAFGITLVLAGPYYREFFLRHADELLSQAPVGEIDATGQLTEEAPRWGLLYYAFVLLDAQAGLVPGFALLAALAATARVAWRGEPRAWSSLLLAAVAPLLFFTLVAKKQAYYTLPALVPLALMAARHRSTRALAIAGALLPLPWVLTGKGPGHGLVLYQLPEAWVRPRHTLLAPPSHADRAVLDEIARTIPRLAPRGDAIRAAAPGQRGTPVLVLSEDERLYEGFLTLALRERVPGAQVRGLALDPLGTTELLDDTDIFVWAGPSADAGWPTAARVDAVLRGDHYDVGRLPPVGRQVEAARTSFAPIGAFTVDDTAVIVYARPEALPVPPGAGAD